MYFIVHGVKNSNLVFSTTNTNALSTSIGGYKHPAVAIFATKSLNSCSIQVCKPNIFYILAIVSVRTRFGSQAQKVKRLRSKESNTMNL